MFDVPREIVWDYEEPPEDELWRLQRILDFFPHYGRDRVTVAALVERLEELRASPEAKALVRLYAEEFDLRARRRSTSTSRGSCADAVPP